MSIEHCTTLNAASFVTVYSYFDKPRQAHTGHMLSQDRALDYMGTCKLHAHCGVDQRPQ